MTAAEKRAHWLHCEALARTPLRELADAYMVAALAVTKGNVRGAARLLGVDRKTLYRAVGEAAVREQREARP